MQPPDLGYSTHKLDLYEPIVWLDEMINGRRMADWEKPIVERARKCQLASDARSVEGVSGVYPTHARDETTGELRHANTDPPANINRFSESAWLGTRTEEQRAALRRERRLLSERVGGMRYE
jgi:hypothetical protein